MNILGIETSCDETAVAIYNPNQGIRAHAIYSQTQTHQPYGGVIPELAARDHIRKLVPLVRHVLTEADCAIGDLNGIAYTGGPGLIGAVLVGATFARSLGYARNLPTVAIHHMEGHLLAPFLEKEQPQFPFVALLVSGGHTLLMQVNAIGEYILLGETLDDSAGEAFDKTAKLLGLPYPGGPELAKLAEKGNPKRFQFPRPMMNRPNCTFSFSGLKTHVWQTWLKSNQDEQTRYDIAYAFQESVVDILISKSLRALTQTQCNELVIAGGVSANLRLRQKIAEKFPRTVKVYFPRHEFCTDNGAMIAYAGYLRIAHGERNDLRIISRARWPL